MRVCTISTVLLIVCIYYVLAIALEILIVKHIMPSSQFIHISFSILISIMAGLFISIELIF